MKRYLCFAVFSLVLASATSAFAQECLLPKPVAVQYALEYLSLIENGGTGILDPVVYGTDPTLTNEICDLLRNYTVVASTRDDSEDVVLGFQDRTCAVSMRLTDDNRIESMRLVGCEMR